ncbi:hypothetical protein AQI88_31060 [Streptomyces cellostaticus]|uniref:Uncharacterized protein n=1 Tax=Streptomyces cellostaticus TaxID=67285 RepID=A0A101NGE1_9ACTN|nr:hypothetical protein [Streptomyces cellostaticus]KUM92607.1 hypothetical protein AQI88_31060 [Streptomyces cellostaticus]
MAMAFGARDLANVRFAVSPMQHLLIGLQQYSGTPLPALRWRRGIRSRVPARALPKIELVGANPYCLPDFLTPPMPWVPGGVSLSDEQDVTGAVNIEQLHSDLARYAELGPLPWPVAQLTDGGDRQLKRLLGTAHAFFIACLADDSPDMTKRLHADISMRRSALGDQGTGRTPAGVHPAFSDPTRFQATLGGLALTVPMQAERSVAAPGFVLAPNLFLGGMISPGNHQPMAAAAVHLHRLRGHPAAAPWRGRPGRPALMGKGGPRRYGPLAWVSLPPSSPPGSA